MSPNTYSLPRVSRVRPGLLAVTDGMAGLSHLMAGLTFNLRRAPFSDPRVRRAIALALDPERFAQTVLRDGAALATGPLPAGHRFARTGVEPIAADLARANQLLDEAGYPRGADGRRFAIEYLSVIEFPLFKPIGDYLRAQLGGKLGVEISGLREVGVNEWRRHMAAGDFDMGLEYRLIWDDPLLGVHAAPASHRAGRDG